MGVCSGFKTKRKMSTSMKSMGAQKCLAGVALPARTSAKTSSVSRRANGAVKVRAAAAGGYVPDMNRRNIMNLLLVGAAGLPATAMAGSFAYFFVPKSAGGGGGLLSAKDALGNDVKNSEWLKTTESETTLSLKVLREIQ